ncbi:hypothetical protein Musp01_01030, partial [Muricauda sp. NBRC 101325]
MINVLSAQVKIGNNPQTLNAASLLELESANRVLVITRVTNAQMNAINPLRGALVFNTDEDCIHYFNGTGWVNICEELDNSFTVSTRADYLGALNPNARDSTVVITTTTNLDDSVNYNFEVGQITGANIIDQSINGDSKLQTSSVTTRVIAPRSVTLNKLADATTGNPGDMFQWNGTQWILVNESTLGITEKDSIIGNEVVGPTDATLLLSGAGSESDPLTLDVSPLGIDTAELADDAVTSIKILNASVTDEKLDKTGIPLSGFGDPLTNVSMGNFQINNLQNPALDTDAVNLQTLNAAITASEGLDDDTDDTNELSDLQLNSTTLELTNPAAGATGVDLDLTFATDTELANAITASETLDNDTDATNELSDIQLNSTTLELTNPAAGATGVDLDLTFATDTELANAITASETLDNDTDDTNELSDIQLNSTTLELTNPAAGATG